jgi:hypothetical protein
MFQNGLRFFEKPHINLKKASIALKMTSKRINTFKKIENSLKITLKCHTLLKKAQITLKKPKIF